MSEIARIQKTLRDFSSERDWDQFHNPKNLVMALTAEVGELVELFQWLTEQQAEGIMESPSRSARVREEIADVTIYLLRIADVLDIDLVAAAYNKLELNASKYPKDEVRGSARKYDEPLLLKRLRSGSRWKFLSRSGNPHRRPPTLADPVRDPPSLRGLTNPFNDPQGSEVLEMPPGRRGRQRNPPANRGGRQVHGGSDQHIDDPSPVSMSTAEAYLGEESPLCPMGNADHRETGMKLSQLTEKPRRTFG